jgi:hypothetical protein
MAQNLIGYGPHTVSANDDYDLLGAQGDEGRDTDVVIGLEGVGGFDGTTQPKSRAQGTSDTFDEQGYTTAAETVAVAAIAAAALPTSIRVKSTGKEIRLTTAARTVGTLRITIRKSNEL